MKWLWRLLVLCVVVGVVSGVTIAIVAPPRADAPPPMVALEGRINSLQRERPSLTVAAWVELFRNAIIITVLVVVVAPFVPLLRKLPKRPRKP